MKFQISVFVLGNKFVADCFTVIHRALPISYRAFHETPDVTSHNVSYSDYQGAYDWLVRRVL